MHNASTTPATQTEKIDNPKSHGKLWRVHVALDCCAIFFYIPHI